MGLLDRLLGRTETRASTSDSYAVAFGIRPTTSGQFVNAALAENLSTISACVGAVASAMASLPPLAFRVTPDGRTELTGHWVNRLFRRPNDTQTWPDFVEWLVSQTLLYGNGLVAIEHDGAGRPTALVPIPWPNVQVSILNTGRLVYDVTRFVAPWGGTGTPRRYLDSEVLHLRDRSDDGLVGRSRISRAPDVIGNAAALQEYSGAMWRNAATPSGAIELEASLTKDQFDRLRQQFEQNFTGTHNAKRVLILDNKATWRALSVSPEDAEVLASRRFSVEECARLFSVPAPIIGDLSHGTFTNSETLIRFFAQSTLNAWCTKFEAAFERSVFGQGNADLELELDLSGLLRGDPEQRWRSYAIAAQHNILDLDEIRAAEGYNPRREPVQQQPAPQPQQAPNA